MLKKRNLLFLSLLILGALLLSSCFLESPATEGILKGQIMVPEGTIQAKDLTGQVLPDATVNIIDLTTGAIIATTVTDADGNYQVSVPPGGPYLLEATKAGVKLQQVTPPVEVGIEYDLGTANCMTTASALIAQAMIDAGDNPASINYADIQTDSNFDDVSSIVCSIIQAGGDPTASAVIEQAVEDFLNPPTPAPTPTPTPTYTVTFDSQGGSAVNSQTVEQGGKVTEPTAPTQTGYGFGGWYKESGCINAWDFDTDTVTTNVMLYARWSISVHNTTQNTYYAAIQAAFDAADSGDTIEVADGTYTESIIFPDGKVIILQSLNGTSSTIISGVDGSATVTCSNSPAGTTMEGFKVTHDSESSGIGIDNNSNLTITDCIITDNHSNVSGEGGGIDNSGPLTITDCTITDNSATYVGGIYNDSGPLTITDCTITGNSGKYFGGGISNYNGPLTITDCTISGNSALLGGGGIFNHSTLTITDCTITGNSNKYNGGGGIYIADGSSTIQNSTISGNTCSDSNGGGIYIESWVSPTIGGADAGDTANFNTICGNAPDQITTPDSYSNNYIFSSCDVIGETGPAGGIIFYDKGSVSDGWRYLEAAPALWNGGSADPNSAWSDVTSTAVGTTGTAIGTGLVNTDAIIAQSGHTVSAAKLCRDYAGGGKTN